MKLKKRLALLLVAVMITTLMPTIGFAEDMAALDGGKTAPVFTDMPNNWSTTALENAVDNGLLKGDNGRLRPGDSLTRAEMASIINRAFGATAEAALTGYQDVSEKSWYYEEMGKALQMGTFQGGGEGLLRPQDPITRQEVFVVVARAFKLNNGSNANLNGFADQAKISSWAMSAAAALVDAGYIQGSNGRLNPKENITRAEFAKIMDSMLTGYLNAPGSVEEIPSGNVMINVPGVTLKNLAVKGDLIIGDGVGEGNVFLENVTIAGRLVVRGGGENSILITGNSKVDSIIIAKVKGKVRVFTADGTEIGEVLADGSDDVILEGNFANIIIQSNNIVVNTVKAEIGEASIEGNNSTLLVGSGSSVETVRVTGNNVTIEGSGDVDAVQVYSANVVVKTMNTAVTAETGSAGVDAAGTSVSDGNTVITRPPATSGGGGGSTAPPPPQSDFAGGAGTVASPYQVATAAQLNKVRDHLDKHFIQTADINLGVAPWNEGNGWVPIGTIGEPFAGSYDGGGFEIENLTINNALLDNAGVFAYAAGEFKRIRLSSGVITAHDNIGLLAGEMTGSVEDSYADGIINGRWHIGVLIGHNKGVVERCYSKGSIIGVNTVGGLVGWNDGNSVTGPSLSGIIHNSYSVVSAAGVNTGGLAGLNQNYGQIINSFSAGPVNGEGGLVGQNVVGGIVTNSFYDSETSGQSDSDRGAPLNTGQMTQQASFSGWDFTAGTGIWSIGTSPASYPYLQWQNENDIPYPPSDFAGGTGTLADPYQVANAEQLNKIRNHLDKHFIQIAAINLNEAPWNQGAGWAPIGDSTTPFTGSYDGNGLTINNIIIVVADSRIGLFGQNNGAIRNLSILDANIDGLNLVGGLAGTNYGIIESCNVSGTIDADTQVGGLVGNNYGDITNCNSSGTVTGVNNVGGLVGYNHNSATLSRCYSNCSVAGTGAQPEFLGGLNGYNNGLISKSFALGDVSSTYLSAGGLVGFNFQGIITDSFALGDVFSPNRAGGLVGDNRSSLINSYSAGAVTGTSDIGGLVGLSSDSGGTPTYTNCYYDSIASGQIDAGKGIPLTSLQMNEASNYGGWDYTSIWGINPGVNSGYPFLRWQGQMAGAGTAVDPYQVASVDHLNLVRNNLSAHYKQVADIDLQTITNWVPIGYNAANPNSPQVFSGSFDGSNYRISNLSTDFHAVGNNNVGLFASSNGATFKNIDLQDVNVHGYMLVGSIVGHLYLSTMENCSANGTVRGEFHTIGGLAGYNHNGTMRMNGFGGAVYAGYGTVGGLTGRTYEALIEDCYSTATVMNLEHYDAGGLVGSHESDSVIRSSYATGNVTGDLETGGLVGRSYSGIGAISESYATGNVSGLSAVGGLIGNNHTGSIISNSYSTGTVTGNNNIGGFAGENIGTIQSSYSRGWVNSSGLNKGGFIGINTNTLTWGTVNSCYYDSDITLLNDSGKGEPRTTAQLNNQATYAGWDFSTIWAIGSGYPYLL